MRPIGQPKNGSSRPNSIPLQAKVRMPLVVPNNHDAQGISTSFVQNMIRKTREIRPVKSTVRPMKARGILGCLADDGPQFGIELISELRRDCVVVFERRRHVLPDKRMENYFHALRSSSTAAQNSSAESADTRPESNSSRRRTASLTDSTEASFPLCGGNDSNSHAASDPRSFSGKSDEAI